MKEAVEVVEQLLRQGQAEQRTRLLRVVTGVGNHSVAGKARIKPAVKSLLASEGYMFNEPRPGVIVVQLK